MGNTATNGRLANAKPSVISLGGSDSPTGHRRSQRGGDDDDDNHHRHHHRKNSNDDGTSSHHTRQRSLHEGLVRERDKKHKFDSIYEVRFLGGNRTKRP